HFEKTALLPVNGVGLLDFQQFILDHGIHPKKLIHERKSNEYTDMLSKKIGEVCKQFYPRPVTVCLSNITSDVYSDLNGGKEYEPKEPNPLLGYRGAYRHLNDPRVLELEIRAIKKVREQMGMNNLHVIIPYVRTVRELELIKKTINACGL